MTDEVRFEVVDPETVDALASVEAYFAELDARFPQGFAGAAGQAGAEAVCDPARKRKEGCEGQHIGCDGHMQAQRCYAQRFGYQGQGSDE